MRNTPDMFPSAALAVINCNYAGVVSVKQTERDDIAEVVFVDDPC